jgi:uncharacterized membrane protein YeaQ/YmgE (transglycosylase-associated protein family)
MSYDRKNVREGEIPRFVQQPETIESTLSKISGRRDEMSLIWHLLFCGLVGAGAVALVKIDRCPCPWWKLLVAFVGGAFGGWLFEAITRFGKASSIDFLASALPAIAMATVFYCIVCPLPPRQP